MKADSLLSGIEERYLDQDDVQLVQKDLFSPEDSLFAGKLDDEVRNIVLDSLALLFRKRSPTILDHLFKYLQDRGRLAAQAPALQAFTKSCSYKDQEPTKEKDAASKA